MICFDYVQTADFWSEKKLSVAIFQKNRFAFLWHLLFCTQSIQTEHPKHCHNTRWLFVATAMLQMLCLSALGGLHLLWRHLV